ncbi:hypothetical protein MAR_015851, partial [Mya arenaria]
SKKGYSGGLGVDNRNCLKKLKRHKKHRNKLIRIAKSSSTALATILEYEKNDVASDSEVDKKIRRAEDRAKSKKNPQKMLLLIVL